MIPFIDKGIPVEYELVRSICTVADQERKKLGVLKTDVQLFGGFSMQGPTEESQLIAELKKQYDVVEVDPSKPIKERYDVLLAVQPSSLTPEAMDEFRGGGEERASRRRSSKIRSLCRSAAKWSARRSRSGRRAA